MANSYDLEGKSAVVTGGEEHRAIEPEELRFNEDVLSPATSFRLRTAIASDIPAVAACVNAACAQLIPRIGMGENIAMYTRDGCVEYEWREGEGFRRVFQRRGLSDAAVRLDS